LVEDKISSKAAISNLENQVYDSRKKNEAMQADILNLTEALNGMAGTNFSSDANPKLQNRINELETELLLSNEMSQAKIKKLKVKLRDLRKLLEALQNSSALGGKQAPAPRRNDEQSGIHLPGPIPTNALQLNEEKLVNMGGHYEHRREHWPNQKLKFEGKIHTKAGCKHGNCLEWYENGVLKAEEEMKDGFRHGWCQDFYENGVLRCKGYFFGGTLCGNGMQGKPDGKKVYEGSYKDDKRWGVGQSYHVNGRIEYDGEWVAGKKAGNGKLYSDGGQIIARGVFENDK